jgi:hypothetical protein
MKTGSPAVASTTEGRGSACSSSVTGAVSSPPSRRIETLPRWLAHPRLPLAAAALAVVLSAPSLWLGLHSDDYVLRMELADPPPAPEWARSPWRLFAFFDSEATIRHAIDSGAAPWWTTPALRLAFFRPLAGLTHWLDFRLWPETPWLMHLQSLAWFSAAIAAAALLYRRLLRPEWVAGLAALVFALDDAHASPAAWIANRNATLGTLFGLLALLAHDRWRRDGWRPGLVLAPLALVAGLLGGEIALATGAYLLAYALFLDEGPWPARLASLVPAGLVGLAWALAYRLLGFGASGSAMYIDPVASPLAFARAVVARAPLLLFGQWALPSQLSLLLSERAAHVLWLVACGLTLLLGALLFPLLRRDRIARFFALGMLLSLLPACATFPHDRLLFLAGFGGAGLLAQLLAGLLDPTAWLPRARAWRATAFVAGATLAAVHLLLAPIGLARGAADLRAFGRLVEQAAASLPNDPQVSQQQVVIVQTPTAFVSIYGPPVLAAAGRPTPRRLLVLGSGIHTITVERPDADSLLVRPDGGYLLPPGSALPGTAQPSFDPLYLMPLFDRLYRDANPLRLGERIELTGVTIEVTALTADGRPAAARFRFEAGLDDPSLRWLRWDDGVYVPFGLPDVGSSVTLPPARVRLF